MVPLKKSRKDQYNEIKQLHLDAFAWRAQRIPFGIWVVDNNKFITININDPDFDKKFFERQMEILEDTLIVASDLIPVLGITNYGIAPIPSLFGAPLLATSNNVDLIEETGYWVEPIIKGIQDIDKLIKQKYSMHLMDGIEQHLRFYQEHKPNEVWISNSLDGPFSVAELLRGPALYTDLYDDPQFVHALLGLCTNAIIENEHRLRTLLHYENVIPFPTYFGIWAPALRFGDDSIINLSEEMICEFVLPYYEKISKEFNCPLLIHFCSVQQPVGEQILKAFVNSDAIVGISSQLGFELYDAWEEKIRGKLTIECGYGNGVEYGSKKYGSFKEFAKHLKQYKSGGMIFYTTVGSIEEGKRLLVEWNQA